VTTPAPGDREESSTAQTLAALEMLGFKDGDRLRLRFSFEASSRRRAVELAIELRSIVRNVVQVRPGPQRLRSRWPWTVVLSTSPTLLAPAVIRSRESDLREIARRRPGCRYVGWSPVLDALAMNQIVRGKGDA
jgi:hypothetical protein